MPRSTIENIHRNQSLGKPLTVAILDGAHEVIPPLTVATLAICIVFFPVVLLYGVARYLFIPLGADRRVLHVGLLRAVLHNGAEHRALAAERLSRSTHGPRRGCFGVFERGFGRLHDGYGSMLEAVLRHRVFVLACAGALLLVAGVAGARDRAPTSFPAADVGLIKLHYRAPAGTRLEVTENNWCCRSRSGSGR